MDSPYRIRILFSLDIDFLELAERGYDTQQIARTLNSDINLVALKADTLISQGYRLRQQEHFDTVCRYSGSTDTKDLVIAGHNYKRHFGELTNLQPGNEVTLQTMDGQEYCYQVATLETLTSTATKEMTAGDYPLTLFTCDYSGQARITVRCQQKA